MKKLSTVIIILILEIVFHNMNYVNAQPDPKLDELNKVSDYKNNKGTMGNVMNLYTSPPVEGSESSTLNWTNSMRIDIVNLRK